MLMIRKEQILAFERIDPKSFATEMLDHVSEHFAKYVEVLGEETTMKVIHSGFEQAKQYAFVTRHELFLFVDLCIMLGRGFGADPQFPWAAKILEDGLIKEPTERIDQLYDQAMNYLDKVVGKDNVFAVGPLRTLLDYPFGNLARRLTGAVEISILDEYRMIWPRKYSFVGGEQLKVLAKSGMKAAAKYGLTSNPGQGLFLILMFVFGHRFDEDPQYTLLANVLNDPKLVDETQKIGRLHTVLRAELTKALG